MFGVSCAPCHGRNGEGGQAQAEGVRPPDLTRGIFKGGDRDADLYCVIAKGVAGSEMPGFESLGGDSIWRLVTFVRSLSRVEAVRVGDAVAGEALFWGKGNCGRCHQVGEKGLNLGPDLSRGSRRATPARVKRAIVEPDESVVQAFALVKVVTREGKTVTGLARFFDNFSVRLVDMDGNEKTYLREDVASIEREMKSLMPGDYGKIFSERELDDVVAYIFKLRSQVSLR